MDARFSRSAISKGIEKVVIELKAKLGIFAGSKKISICADIWTKRGMSSSYLGITRHFYSKKDHHRHTVTLAVHRLPSTHTGDNIGELVDDVLNGEWEIPHSRVSATLTDNGSNILAAFHPRVFESVDDVEEDDGVDDNWDDGDTVPDITSLVVDVEEHEMDHDSSFTH